MLYLSLAADLYLLILFDLFVSSGSKAYVALCSSCRLKQSYLKKTSLLEKEYIFFRQKNIVKMRTH